MWVQGRYYMPTGKVYYVLNLASLEVRLYPSIPRAIDAINEELKDVIRPVNICLFYGKFKTQKRFIIADRLVFGLVERIHVKRKQKTRKITAKMDAVKIPQTRTK